MEVALEAGDLLTVAGAGAAAFIVAQFSKMLFSLGAAGTRIISLVTGLVLVVVAHVTAGVDLTPVGVVLAAIVGMQAGMSASAMFDAATKGGLSYEVAAQQPAPITSEATD